MSQFSTGKIVEWALHKKTEILEENQSQRHFVHQKSHRLPWKRIWVSYVRSMHPTTRSEDLKVCLRQASSFNLTVVPHLFLSQSKLSTHVLTHVKLRLRWCFKWRREGCCTSSHLCYLQMNLTTKHFLAANTSFYSFQHPPPTFRLSHTSWNVTHLSPRGHTKSQVRGVFYACVLF
jgi:hypothetical protein